MKRKIKTAAAGARRAIKPRLPALLLWAVALWITAKLYDAASTYATIERGYKAIGGEVFIWLLPLGAYALAAWVVRYARRWTPIDAEYIPIQRGDGKSTFNTMRRLRREEEAGILPTGFARIAAAMLETGVSAMEAAEAFQKAMHQLEHRPLEIAFLGHNLRTTQFEYMQFIRDNDLFPGYSYQGKPPTTLGDGTRITLMSAQVMDVVARGRRFDQVIVASAPGGRFAAELAEPICELKARSTGRVPEEYFLQFYDDAPQA